jgi:hypothetical protein
MLRELSFEFCSRRKSEKDGERKKFERCGQQGVTAGSNDSTGGYTGRTCRLKYNVQILALKIKVVAVIHVISTKCMYS